MNTHKNRQPNLSAVIVKDLGRNLSTLGLLFLIFVSAISVVYVTHMSRQQVILQDKLLQNKDELDLSWRYLLVEQKFYSEHSRVEEIATEKLNMKRPEAKDETVVQLQ